MTLSNVYSRFNGQQVAVRGGVTLTSIYGDHLGSASVMANLSGTKVSEVRYYPFVETRRDGGQLRDVFAARSFSGKPLVCVHFVTMLTGAGDCI
jgi:hypothetical protein